jgi:hypothetical protein
MGPIRRWHQRQHHYPPADIVVPPLDRETKLNSDVADDLSWMKNSFKSRIMVIFIKFQILLRNALHL